MKWLRAAVICLLIIVFLVRVFDFFHIQFDSDYGRDALFGLRILHDKPTLLGAQASVGGFYLGPLYFYTIATLFSVFGPVPEIIMLFFALLNVLAAWIGWRTLSQNFGRRAGFIFLLLFAFSAPLIAASRGATHMPMLPVITVLVIALLTRALKTGKFRDHFFSGLALGLYLHVHFSALLLFPGYFAAVVLLTQGGWRERVRSLCAASLALLLMASPLILFDMRHGFITSKAFFQYLTSSAAGGSIRAAFPHWTLSQKIFELLKYLGGFSIISVLAVGLAAVGFFGKLRRDNGKLKMALFSMTVSAVGLLLLYHGYLFSYYLIVPGTLVIFLISFGLGRLKVFGLILALIICIGEAMNLPSLYVQNWRNVGAVARIASLIEQHQSETGNRPFEVFKDSADGMTGLAYEYRFVLTRDGYQPVSEYEYAQAKFLYVIREDGKSDPMTLGNYEVAQFGPKKIQWQDIVNLGGKEVDIFALAN